jgi:hypothetical protein
MFDQLRIQIDSTDSVILALLFVLAVPSLLSIRLRPWSVKRLIRATWQGGPVSVYFAGSMILCGWALASVRTVDSLSSSTLALCISLLGISAIFLYRAQLYRWSFNRRPRDIETRPGWTDHTKIDRVSVVRRGVFWDLVSAAIESQGSRHPKIFGVSIALAAGAFASGSTPMMIWGVGLMVLGTPLILIYANWRDLEDLRESFELFETPMFLRFTGALTIILFAGVVTLSTGVVSREMVIFTGSQSTAISILQVAITSQVTAVVLGLSAVFVAGQMAANQLSVRLYGALLGTPLVITSLAMFAASIVITAGALSNADTLFSVSGGSSSIHMDLSLGMTLTALLMLLFMVTRIPLLVAPERMIERQLRKLRPRWIERLKSRSMGPPWDVEELASDDPMVSIVSVIENALARGDRFTAGSTLSLLAARIQTVVDEDSIATVDAYMATRFDSVIETVASSKNEDLMLEIMDVAATFIHVPLSDRISRHGSGIPRGERLLRKLLTSAATHEHTIAFHQCLRMLMERAETHAASLEYSPYVIGMGPTSELGKIEDASDDEKAVYELINAFDQGYIDLGGQLARIAAKSGSAAMLSAACSSILDFGAMAAGSASDQRVQSYFIYQMTTELRLAIGQISDHELTGQFYLFGTHGLHNLLEQQPPQEVEHLISTFGRVIVELASVDLLDFGLINGFRVMCIHAEKSSDTVGEIAITSIEQAINTLPVRPPTTTVPSFRNTRDELLRNLGTFEHTKFARNTRFRNGVNAAFMRLGERREDYPWRI